MVRILMEFSKKECPMAKEDSLLKMEFIIKDKSLEVKPVDLVKSSIISKATLMKVTGN